MAPSKIATRLTWGSLVLLVFLGVVAVGVRARFPADAAQTLEPTRNALLDALGMTDPRASERASDVAAFDANYAGNPFATALHIASGGVFLLLLPLQLSGRVRARRPALHRASGRVMLGAGLGMVSTALYFGLLMPYAGSREAVAIALVSVWFLYAAGRAIQAIRRREVATHREWMLRAIAVPLGVSVVRIVALALELTLLSAALGLRTVFALSIWIGWAITLAGAELWIRRTRVSVMEAKISAKLPDLAAAS
jgi:uncharacterized membrane protein